MIVIKKIGKKLQRSGNYVSKLKKLRNISAESREIVCEKRILSAEDFNSLSKSAQ